MADLDFDVIHTRAMVELAVFFDSDFAPGTSTPTLQASPYSVVPSSVTVTRNPHNQAGTCDVEIDASALTFGQRTINNIFLTAFMGVVERVDDSILKPENVVFCGYVDMMGEKRDDKGPTVTLKCRDLSMIFREAKPLVTRVDPTGARFDPTPRYSDTVLAAIQRVMQWVGVGDDVLEISDPSNLGSLSLGKAVSSRGHTGYLPIKRQASAWEAIEHICGVADVLVSIDRGKLVLRSPSDIFGMVNGQPAAAAYDFVFGLDGGNALSVERQKKFERNRKGVKVVGFDPASRSSIEVDWPSDKDVPPKARPKPRHTGQSAAHISTAKTPKTVIAPERDIYTFSGISSKDQLLAIAQHIYAERSKQELEGSIETINWAGDLFALENGDRINLTVGQKLEAELRNFNSTAEKLAFLESRVGMAKDAAQFLLSRTVKEETPTPYYLRSISHTWNRSNGGRSHIDFINLMYFQ